jgi:hypothetical protein
VNKKINYDDKKYKTEKTEKIEKYIIYIFLWVYAF